MRNTTKDNVMNTYYDKQAMDFLKSTNTDLTIKFIKNDYHFDGDKEKRDIYKFTFKRGSRSFYGQFGQSISDIIHKPIEPTAYDILACLTKYDPGTFEDFCREFGYDTDSRSAEKTYNAVCEEYEKVKTIWTDAEIEQLAEIQ